MSEEKQEQKPKTPIDFSHIGGKKVGHLVPVNKEIDFSSIPGVRCVMQPPVWPETKPAEPQQRTKQDV
jgi:hypothetical protein